MFSGFEKAFADVNGVDIFYRRMGKGEPILLLHGFPQTHAMWADIARELAENFTVVCSDLRGYGASSKPKGVQNYSFREMGNDQLRLMSALNFKDFHLVGHDRGGRIAHRIALDAPDRVKSITLMDIVPTYLLLKDLKKTVAYDYYHWFLLSQPSPLPERLIATDPDYFYETFLTNWGSTNLSMYSWDKLQAYRTAWRNPECIRAMCDDYRAAIHFDFGIDAVDLERRVMAPALIMWGTHGAMAKSYCMETIWQDRLTEYRAAAVEGGHFFPDTDPQKTYEALIEFFSSFDKI